MYTLGIITGLIIAVFILISLIYLRQNLERTVKQLQSKIAQKGKLIEPDESGIENWIDQLPIEKTQ